VGRKKKLAGGGASCTVRDLDAFIVVEGYFLVKRWTLADLSTKIISAITDALGKEKHRHDKISVKSKKSRECCRDS
jgi:hypothetical protein